MKRCPSCNQTYTDEALNFCLEDGTPLVVDPPATPVNAATVPMTPRYTDPPPTQIYQPNTSPTAQPWPQTQPTPYQPQPQYSPLPPPRRQRSSAVWWILGGLAVVTVLGIGIAVILIAVASISSDSNNNRSSNVNNRNGNANRLSNTNSSNNSARENPDPATTLPASASDDFSKQLWGVGTSQYGDTWYADNEYHMRSKDKTYLVMYAPNTNDYKTENATVRITTRNVDGISPVYGYGLLVLAAKSKDKNELEDYGFLIRTNETPAYKVVLHRDGKETNLVDWTTSDAIHSGTSPNLIEVRIKDRTLALYLNNQYATSITDSVPYKRGLAGLYTSDEHEIAFDDLEITR